MTPDERTHADPPAPPTAAEVGAVITRVLAHQSVVALSAHLVLGAVTLGAVRASQSSSAVLLALGMATVATGIPRLRAIRTFGRLHRRAPALWARAYRVGALISSLGISVGTALLLPFVCYDRAPRLLFFALAGLGLAGVALIASDVAILTLLDLCTRLAPRPALEPRRVPRETTDSVVTAPPLPAVGTVLVVEDEPANQVLLATYLRRMGATVRIAENGRVGVDDAIAAIRRGQPFDVILMDMQMPVLDGYAATAQLRSRGYRGPILAVTAHAVLGDREKCLAAGCDDYLTKPIDRRALVATVERLAAHSRARAAFEDTIAGPIPSSRKLPLLSLLAGDPDMDGILAGFLETLGARAAALEGALLQRDVTALKRLAHQLKGVAGGYGFPSITEQAKVVEDALESEDDAAAAAAVDALRTLCLRARDGAETTSNAAE